MEHNGGLPFVTETPVHGAGEAPSPAGPSLEGVRQLQDVMGLLAQVLRTPTVVNHERALSWGDMKMYPGKSDRVDAWFLLFEAKMKGARIPEEKWGEKLCECPHFPNELKVQLSSVSAGDYSQMRKFCLDQDGPVYPTGFFQSYIYSTRGSTGEEVLRKLKDGLALYNRAARDAGEAEWTNKQLLYPFANAFPPETSKVLRQHLSLCLHAPDPFRELVARAPTAEDGLTTGKPAEVPLVAAAQAAPGSPSTLDVTQQVLAALKGFKKEFKRELKASFQPPAKRYGQDSNSNPAPAPCPGCGGFCVDRLSCRARGKTCNNCGLQNHFANVCRKPRLGGGGTPQRSFGGGPARPFQNRGRPSS